MMNTTSTKKNIQHAISPTRNENYPEWYQEVIKASDLAENSPTRGCMIIKPWGYGIWENVQSILDKMIKETGHVNAYFPLLIPLSFLEKEADHIEGFAKECAVVTHHRLESDNKGKLIPKGKLEEPLIVRPTSEAIVGDSYSRWVKSYRDLPILINQWANVMRWEMRTRMFLRTSEFLWQEGHTAHSTKDEAWEETLKMLDVYKSLAHDYLAIPTITGAKTPDERFPGAVETYTIESMCQDRKALQAGTSHFLGQNFAKGFDIKFSDKDGSLKYAWTTSWGVTTRLIGGLVMTHADDDGLVLPPKIAPTQIVIIPRFNKKTEDREDILKFCEEVMKNLINIRYADSPIRVKIDKRDINGSEKVWEHIKKGVPIRLEIGQRDLKNKSVFMGRRDKNRKDKKSIPADDFCNQAVSFLTEIHNNIYEKAKDFMKDNLKKIDSLEEFKEFFTPEKSSKQGNFGGFAMAHWNKAAIGHSSLKELKVTPRCIPLPSEELNIGMKEKGKCIFTGKDSDIRVLFARSY